MRLASIRTLGVAGFRDRKIDFVADPEASCVTFVTGGMGSGKTLLLDAIVSAKDDIGSYGTPSLLVEPAIGNDAAKLETRWLLSEAERVERALDGSTFDAETFVGARDGWPDHPPDLHFLLRRYEVGVPTQKVEYFHARRDIDPAEVRTREGAMPPDVPLRLSKDNRKYAGFRSWLLEGSRSFDDAPPKLASVAEKFSMLCPTKRLIDAFIGTSGIRVTFESPRGDKMDLDCLSDGERQAFLFAATFERSVLHDSILLIDEPERSIPPRLVRGFFDALMGLGVRNQFIVATQSAELLATAHASQIVSLDG